MIYSTLVMCLTSKKSKYTPADFLPNTPHTKTNPNALIPHPLNPPSILKSVCHSVIKTQKKSLNYLL